jgi:hypothetical protein
MSVIITVTGKDSEQVKHGDQINKDGCLIEEEPKEEDYQEYVNRSKYLTRKLKLLVTVGVS